MIMIISTKSTTTNDKYTYKIKITIMVKVMIQLIIINTTTTTTTTNNNNDNNNNGTHNYILYIANNKDTKNVAHVRRPPALWRRERTVNVWCTLVAAMSVL